MSYDLRQFDLFAPNILGMFGTKLVNSDQSLEVTLILKPQAETITSPMGHFTEEIQLTGYGVGDEIPERTVLADPDGNHYNVGKGLRQGNGWWAYQLVCQEAC